MSKARKILKRTLVGGSLAGTVALLLWWTSTSADGRPIFYAAAAITLLAVWESSRMGSLALLDLFPPLVLAALGVLALTDSGIEAHGVVREAPPGGDAAPAVFAVTPTLLYGFALLAGLAGYAITRAAKRLTGSPLAARLVAYVVVGGLTFYARDDIQAQHTHVESVLWALGGITALCSLLREPGGFARLSVAGLLSAWIVPALPLLWTIWERWGTRGLVALLVLSKIGDTCGYYVGSAIGKSHPFPRISPGKTTAGCVGSFVGATAMGGVLWASHVVPDGRLGLAGALLAAGIVNLAAQAGDLLESLVKRKAGVKDSSGIFGPSGGLLDQIDSLLISVPVACVVWPMLLS